MTCPACGARVGIRYVARYRGVTLVNAHPPCPVTEIPLP